ncbi:MAG: Ig-like domain-containing protein [Tannerella sp.]|jgi:hypothetical protein|nr:Ig-like domain-containing protein [Tannerella sp.]
MIKNRIKFLAVAMTIIAAAVFGMQSCSNDDEKNDYLIIFEPKNITMLVNSTATITASTYPATVDLTWESDNPSVATVNGQGVVTAVSAGTANISATSTRKDRKSKVCAVTVIGEIEIKLSANAINLVEGNTQTLTAEIIPSNVSQEVTWSSGDLSVATVDGSGTVTAIAAGTTTITATSALNPGRTAECSVTVELLLSIVAMDKITGLWRFEDANNLTMSTIGSNLQATGGAYESIDGPDGTKAVKPSSGSTYKIIHNIPANGGGARVNEYTLMLDIRGTKADFNGWISVCNTRDGNNGEGVLWIDDVGRIGYATLGGYSSITVQPDTWHRVVIAAKLGESLKIYIDGNLAFTASNNIDKDGLMSLPLDGLHVGTDGTNYPGPSFAEICIWNQALTDDQIAELGGVQ